MNVSPGRPRKQRIVFVIGIFALVGLFCALGGRTKPHHIATRTSPGFSQRQKCDELVTAAGDGDMKTMKRLLDSGVSPNADNGSDKQGDGISALSNAASCGHLDAVQLLLDRGADVNADDFWGGNALVGASLWGQVDVVKCLIAHGADPNMDDDGASALGYAAHQLVAPENIAPAKNYVEIVRLLKSVGAKSANPFWPF